MRAADDADPVVVVRVLSKQVRLLSEGVLEEIVISADDDAAIIDEIMHRQERGKSITIRMDNGVPRVAIDAQPVTGPIALSIRPGPGGGTCRVRLSSEERTFPLPFSITGSQGELRCHVRERLSRYAVDSALAEYGGEFRDDREAVLALAHVIRARYFFMKRAPAHGDADFCDLAHCQAYRGRIRGGAPLGDGWTIDHEKISKNLFFNSRCGGSIFSDSVFGRGPRPAAAAPAARDWLYREGSWLCRDAASRWECTIRGEELGRIVFPERGASGTGAPRFEYDRGMLVVRVRGGGSGTAIPVETFRLTVNRVRGWNFIKSNKFEMTEESEGEGTRYRFRGEGLGHGAGLCQHGAAALSRRGYNRYEIIEHYFPDLQFRAPRNKPALPPGLSYCIVDLASGNPLEMSHGRDFLKRRVPPGSIFKLIVALYLAAERPDLFYDYTYDCAGKNRGDHRMPDRCWDPAGHGTVRIGDAVAHSCNLYFASLYDKIPEKRFRIFYERLSRSLGISSVLPEVADERGWSKLLAGLDSRLSFPVGDYIRLAMYLDCDRPPEGYEKQDPTGPALPERRAIFKSMKRLFIDGTASPRSKDPAGRGTDGILEQWEGRVLASGRHEFWGKTATIADGTNSALGYGVFIGGSGTTGIVAVARRSSGRMAARWARIALIRYIDNARPSR